MSTAPKIWNHGVVLGVDQVVDADRGEPPLPQQADVLQDEQRIRPRWISGASFGALREWSVCATSSIRTFTEPHHDAWPKSSVHEQPADQDGRVGAGQ